MKKIITAMGSNRLAYELQKTGQFKIVTKDIPYKEGIIEVLEEISDIDLIIISQILDGEISFEDVIKRILEINEKIEIIAFVEEKNAEIQSFLFSNGIYKIYQNNEIDIDSFVESLGVEKVKPNVIIENEPSPSINFDFSKFEERGRVISITGSYNSGKSTLACLLAKEYASQGKKTLLIDFDIYNSSINILLEIQKYNNKESTFSLENQTVKLSQNEDVLCAMDLLFKNTNSVDFVNLEKMLKEFKYRYDIIIIDNTSNYNYKYFQRILDASDEIIFLFVPSKVELKKSFDLFEVMVVDFKINRSKINIILNKVTSESMNKAIVSKVFGNIKISGVAEFDEKIEKNINSKVKVNGGIKWE